MTTTMAAVKDFVSQKKIAVVGVSRNKGKFGNSAYVELKKRGYELTPVHPQLEMFDHDRCAPSLASLNGDIGAVLVVVPPTKAVEVVKEAAAAGMKHVWLQQGAESDAALSLGKELGVDVISGHCILMYSDPVSFPHSIHRWIWDHIGKSPK